MKIMMKYFWQSAETIYFCRNYNFYVEGCSYITLVYNNSFFGRSRSEVFHKKVALKKSKNSQENTCHGVLALTTLQAWPITLPKEEFCGRFFNVNFTNFFRGLFL